MVDYNQPYSYQGTLTQNRWLTKRKQSPDGKIVGANLTLRKYPVGLVQYYNDSVITMDEHKHKYEMSEVIETNTKEEDCGNDSNIKTKQPQTPQHSKQPSTLLLSSIASKTMWTSSHSYICCLDKVVKLTHPVYQNPKL